MIKLYFHHTPNPLKVVLFLEEAGLDYQLVPVDTYKGEQHAPAFRAVNPNGKVSRNTPRQLIVHYAYGLMHAADPLLFKLNSYDSIAYRFGHRPCGVLELRRKVFA